MTVSHDNRSWATSWRVALSMWAATLLQPHRLHAQAATQPAMRGQAPACASASVDVRVLGLGAPLPGAAVRLGEQVIVSDSGGWARFGVRVADSLLIEVTPPRGRRLAPRTLRLAHCPRSASPIFVRLAERSVQLEQVVVTATEVGRSSDGGTVTRIGRDAIEHLQASSLADILQLVPGQPAVNPSVAAPRQALLRQAPTAAGRDPGPGVEAERANALGTSVVLDGVPLSNDANLQTNLTILNSGPNALPAFASTAGRGFDLRQIPADQVERVDVVRGVPSARHGDLTAGAILVTSRAGARAPEFRVRANPQTFEVSSAGGWALPQATGLSLDFNLVRSTDDPRSSLDVFTRATMQAALTRDRASHALSLRVRGYGVVDQARRDPDELRYQRAVSSRDDGGRVDLRARLGSRDAWHMEFTGSTTLAAQRSSYQELVTRDIFPVASSRVDTLAPGAYGRSEYLARLTVDGRPLNAYARLEARKPGRGVHHRLEPVVGLELRHDGNAGDGRLFDPLEPPRQNYAVGDRPQTFSSIPAQTQLAAYAEERWRHQWRGRLLDASIGARLDALDPATNGAHGVRVVPRTSAAIDLGRGITLRASAGAMSKAPTLSQRYPLPRYFDLTSFNYYASVPAERLVLFTTRVIDARDAQLQSALAVKHEWAIDYARHGVVATVALFDERTRGVVGTTRVPVGIEVPQYRALSTPAGRPPILEPAPFRVDSFVGLYDRPRNSRAVHTRGAEFTTELPEWKRLGTQLALTGGWFRSVATDSDVEIPVEQFISGSTQPTRVGVYAAGRGLEAQRFLTSLRLVHRAPALGMAATLLWQVTWQDDDRPVGRTDGVPVGYVDRSGRITLLTRDVATSPAFAGLVRQVTPLEGRWERRPPLHLLTMRLTKTLPGHTQVALFLNNALADRPLYRRQRQLGFERRNEPAFFGVELLATLPSLPARS